MFLSIMNSTKILLFASFLPHDRYFAAKIVVVDTFNDLSQFSTKKYFLPRGGLYCNRRRTALAGRAISGGYIKFSVQIFYRAARARYLKCLQKAHASGYKFQSSRIWITRSYKFHLATHYTYETYNETILCTFSIMHNSNSWWYTYNMPGTHTRRSAVATI